jgi:hypothetical protein
MPIEPARPLSYPQPISRAHRSGRVLVATLSLATVWGCACVVVLTAFTVYDALMGTQWAPRHVPVPRILAALGIADLVVGFLTGALFAMVLRIAERRNVLGRLSPIRIALWGALAATLVSAWIMYLAVPSGAQNIMPASMMWMIGVTIVGKAAVLGAVCGVATLAIARRDSARIVIASARS